RREEWYPLTILNYQSMAFWISSGRREPQHYNTTNSLLKAGQNKNGRKIQNHPESVLHFLSIGDFLKMCKLWHNDPPLPTPSNWCKKATRAFCPIKRVQVKL
ncbi:hypothetical protein E2320_018749, partial [Naja naja]